jgi:hypothetical protein
MLFVSFRLCRYGINGWCSRNIPVADKYFDHVRILKLSIRRCALEYPTLRNRQTPDPTPCLVSWLQSTASDDAMCIPAMNGPISQNPA